MIYEILTWGFSSEEFSIGAVVFFKIWTCCRPFLALGIACAQIEGGLKQCFGSGGIRVFSTIRIRMRPLINLWDLNDGFDKVSEEPDQKGQC